MIRRTAVAAALCALMLPLAGCLTAPVMPPIGMIYTDYSAPLDHNLEGNPVGSRSGSSETISVLGLVALGDGSIREAARQGGVNSVHHADYEYFNVLGVYQKYTTVVYGE